MWQDDNKQTGTRSTGIEPAAMTPTSRDTEHGVGVRDGWLVRVVVNVCRLVLGATLVLSSFVKAIDPLGTQYKIQDYLTAVGWPGIAPDVVTIGASVLLSAFEFSIGIFVLFAIRRRLVSKLALALMSVMTIVTLWILVANPVKDCGCFGDFVVLTNVETFLKNIVLLACAIVLAKWPLAMYRFLSRSTQWIAINFTILFIIVTSGYCLYKLPIFDFRPYRVGMNILKGMEIPEGAPQPKFETTFIMEKNGQRKEFSLENYPDSTWQFIDSKTVQIEPGYVPPIHDFSIQRADGYDITEETLSRPGYLFLLISPHLGRANDTNFGDIDQIYEYARQAKVPFYCLTASSKSEIDHWKNLTGAEYPFYFTDETTLKTVIRSNPGLLLLKDGTIIRKWSHNGLPKSAELVEPLVKSEIGRPAPDTVGKIVAQVLAWFFIPLILLTLADRAWAWSGRLRRKTRNVSDKREGTVENE